MTCNMTIVRGWLCALLLGLACTIHAQEFQYLPELEIVDLKPQMRPIPLSAALYSISTDRIITYLENILIFDSKDEYETLPYIVGFDRDNTMVGAGDIAYTRGLSLKRDLSEYSFLHPGAMLVHPETKEELGLEAYIIGRGTLKDFGETQTVLVTESSSILEVNTRLVPLVGVSLPASLEVKYPPKKLEGFVVAIPPNKQLAGVYSPVVISLGRRDGLRQGHVLDLIEGIREVDDPNTYTRKEITLPYAKIGEVLIYSVREKISLGLITYATRAIFIDDRVDVPDLEY